MFQRICSTIALSMSLLLVGADASAQIVQAARIEILPSVTPSSQQRVFARISYDQVACFTFTTTVTTQPGGVFVVSTYGFGIAQPFPCTQTFDVDLGVLPEGGYSVLVYAAGVVLLTAANFTVVGPAQIPALSQGGIAILAIVLALTGFVFDAKARRKLDSNQGS